ncbi:hypothetical protein Psfp_00134 [Pelotomaculum sp. FP]|nr:hypothetical protein Psfp_00134 [Pelotomaculum sp. FP]
MVKVITGSRKAFGVVGLGLSSALFAILHLCNKSVMLTASTDSHPVATRYLSFTACNARAKERTQVLRSLRITPSPQVKPFRAIFLSQVRQMT